MTTLERRKLIKEKIDFSDESTLAKIEKILDKERIVLPQFVIDDIANAKKQYENGEFLSEEEAEKDFEIDELISCKGVNREDE